MNKLIELFEREAGHILILFFLVLMGIAVYIHAGDKEIATLSFGALLAILKGNSQRTPPPTNPPTP